MNTPRVFIVGLLGVGLLTAGVVPAAGASRTQAVTSTPVNTTECPEKPPVLVNGSFEKFSDPDENPDVATGLESRTGPIYGKWHGYQKGPNQILFLKPTAAPTAGQDANYITGWKSTSPLIEIQRQVPSYTTSIDNLGRPAYDGSSLSGVATAANTTQSGHWDRVAPQPADGDYWAELNSIGNFGLYQDITVPSSARLFWSLKHRGRTNTNEEMRVLIGPVKGGIATLTPETSMTKYSPTDSNKFDGEPTYGSSAPVTRIVGNLRAGWEMYEGSYPAESGATDDETRVMRFQFEAVRGSNGWVAVGNLLDDIRFIPFLACPVTRYMHLGETDRLDVTGKVTPGSGERVSYGLRQTLDGISNSTAPAGQFTSSGNTVSFTPAQVGEYSVDYEVSMTFAGRTFTAASRITYKVFPGPVVIFDANGGSLDVETLLLNKNAPLSSITLPTPDRKGYGFVGWFTRPSGGTEVTPEYAAATIPTDDVTLYARWENVEDETTDDGESPGSSTTGGSGDRESSSLPATGLPMPYISILSLGAFILGVTLRRRPATH